MRLRGAAKLWWDEMFKSKGSSVRYARQYERRTAPGSASAAGIDRRGETTMANLDGHSSRVIEASRPWRRTSW